MPDFINETLNSIRKPAEILPEPLSLDDLEALDLPDTQWIHDTLLPYPGLVALSGAPGSYKTFFALWMALRASQGLTLFDGEGSGGLIETGASVPTLFIEEENEIRTMRSRLLSFKRDRKADLYFYIDCGFKMSDESWREKVLEFVEAKGIKLIFMDPFSSVMGLKDENSNAEVAVVMDIIRKEFVKRNITVVFIHHPSKGGEGGASLRGAGDILGKVDVHLTFAVESVKDRLISVKYAKMRVADSSQLKDFQIQLVGEKGASDWEFVHKGELKPKGVDERDNLKASIIKAFETGEEFGRKEIAELVGASNSGDRFTNVWNSLVEIGEIKQVKRGRFVHKFAI